MCGVYLLLLQGFQFQVLCNNEIINKVIAWHTVVPCVDRTAYITCHNFFFFHKLQYCFLSHHSIRFTLCLREQIFVGWVHVWSFVLAYRHPYIHPCVASITWCLSVYWQNYTWAAPRTWGRTLFNPLWTDVIHVHFSSQAWSNSNDALKTCKMNHNR